MRTSAGVFERFQRHGLPWSFKPPKKSESLKPENWLVEYAPAPDDIYWENLTESRTILSIKSIAGNGLLLIFMIFVTTPQHAVHHIDEFLGNMIGGNMAVANSFLEYLSSLLLWAFTFILPFLVGRLDKWIGHITRSEVKKYDETKGN